MCCLFCDVDKHFAGNKDQGHKAIKTPEIHPYFCNMVVISHRESDSLLECHACLLNMKLISLKHVTSMCEGTTQLTLGCHYRTHKNDWNTNCPWFWRCVTFSYIFMRCETQLRPANSLLLYHNTAIKWTYKTHSSVKIGWCVSVGAHPCGTPFIRLSKSWSGRWGQRIPPPGSRFSPYLGRSRTTRFPKLFRCQISMKLSCSLLQYGAQTLRLNF